MKQFIRFIFLACTVFLTACFEPREHEEPATIYKPMLMKRSDLNTSVAWQGPRAMKHPGKIFYKDGYILIADQYEGIHVIDNSNPSVPVKVGFLRIPGCNDLAIKNKILYADNATDLVTINFNNPLAPVLINRKTNVFPEPMPPDLRRLPQQYAKENRPDDMVIVGWITNN